MSAALEVVSLNTTEAAAPPGPFQVENNVLAFLGLPEHLRILPDVFPPRTEKILSALYSDSTETPDMLLFYASAAIDSLEDPDQRIDCIFKLSGFDDKTLALTTKNLRRSWLALRKQIRHGKLELVVDNSAEVPEAVGGLAVEAEVVVAPEPCEQASELLGRTVTQSMLSETLNMPAAATNLEVESELITDTGTIENPVDASADVPDETVGPNVVAPTKEVASTAESVVAVQKPELKAVGTAKAATPNARLVRPVAPAHPPTSPVTIVYSRPVGKTAPVSSLEAAGLKDLFGLDEEQSWQERALCATTDPEAFFPEKGGSTREAKKICINCEVRKECLEYALEHDERFGVWGGLSERERRRIKRRST